MSKNILLTLALGALLMGTGAVVGTRLDGDETSPVVLPDPLRAETPRSAPTTPAPGLAPMRSEDGVAIRLARLEEQIAVLIEQQQKMRLSLEPAGELVAFLNARMPSLKKAAASTNQVAAIATLRNVTSAQAQFQQSGKADTDQDGVGEYAGFREMSGAAAGRMRSMLVPPVLSSVFRELNANGEATRSGYLYRFYLPGPGGEGIGEPTEGFTTASGIDADLAETTWCAYAWPRDAKSGTTVYFMNQGGDVLVTEDASYVGTGNGPAADAAFKQAGAITSQVAINSKGNDGNVWQVAR